MILHLYQVKFENLADTMTQEIIITCGGGPARKRFNLEFLASKYLGIKYAKTNQLDLFGNNEYVGTLTKDTAKTFRSIAQRPFSYDQIFYGLCDVELTYRIYQKQLVKIADDDLFRCALLEHEYLKVLGTMELNGFYMDLEK